MILVDAGGTYVRFAKSAGDSFESVEKYEASQFGCLKEAVASYAATHDLAGGSLRIATAAYPDTDGCWRFVNNNKWVIDPVALGEAGWPVDMILNDFEAATAGIVDLPEDGRTILKPGKAAPGFSKCLTGPGTGLGLGYLRGDGKVQKTHGGHLLAASFSDEQAAVIAAVRAAKADDTVAVYENFVSGPGFYNIYRAVCSIKDLPVEIESVEHLLDHPDLPTVKDTVRLFCEFFGLFSHNVVVAGHAYDGLYLTGGVMTKLVDSGVFDFAQFEKYFTLPCVHSVRQAVADTPVIHVTAPRLSFRGLLKFHND